MCISVKFVCISCNIPVFVPDSKNVEILKKGFCGAYAPQDSVVDFVAHMAYAPQNVENSVAHIHMCHIIQILVERI